MASQGYGYYGPVGDGSTYAYREVGQQLSGIPGYNAFLVWNFPQPIYSCPDFANNLNQCQIINPQQKVIFYEPK